MGYERDGRYGERGDETSRQPRQDYDRSYGRGSYGAGDQQRNGGDGNRSGYGRGEQGRDGFGRGEQGRYGADRSRDYGRYARDQRDDDRGFIDRAGDEVRSWFGDEDAERRRQADERRDERDYRARSGDRDRGNWQDYGQGGFGQSDYGRGGQSGYGQSSYGQGDAGGYGYGASRNRGRHDNDTHYRSWRDRQMEQFDRDYDDYRREHQSKFDQEFHGWRTNRQTQRDSLSRVREHQEVVGSDGQHVGTVDKVRGDQIILTKQDQDAHGRHHAIPSAWIKSVDDKITISKTADEAKAHWRDAESNSAFWNSDSNQSHQAGQPQQPGATQGAQQTASGGGTTGR